MTALIKKIKKWFMKNFIHSTLFLFEAYNCYLYWKKICLFLKDSQPKNILECLLFAYKIIYKKKKKNDLFKKILKNQKAVERSHKI